MAKTPTIIVPAASVQQFAEFIDVASDVYVKGELKFALDSGILQIEDMQSLLACKILCDERTKDGTQMLLQPADIKAIQAFHHVLVNLARPVEKVLLGEELHGRVVASVAFLDDLFAQRRGAGRG